MGTHPIFESDFDCLTVCFLRLYKTTKKKRKSYRKKVSTYQKEMFTKIFFLIAVIAASPTTKGAFSNNDIQALASSGELQGLACFWEVMTTYNLSDSCRYFLNEKELIQSTQV